MTDRNVLNRPYADPSGPPPGFRPEFSPHAYPDLHADPMRFGTDPYPDYLAAGAADRHLDHMAFIRESREWLANPESRDALHPLPKASSGLGGSGIGRYPLDDDFYSGRPSDDLYGRSSAELYARRFDRLDTTDGFLQDRDPLAPGMSRSLLQHEWSGSGLGAEPFREPSNSGLRASEISGLHAGLQSEASVRRLPPGLEAPAPTRTNLGEETPRNGRINEHDELLNGVLGFLDAPTPER